MESQAKNDSFEFNEKAKEQFNKVWDYHDPTGKKFVDLSEAYLVLKDV